MKAHCPYCGLNYYGFHACKEGEQAQSNINTQIPIQPPPPELLTKEHFDKRMDELKRLLEYLMENE